MSTASGTKPGTIVKHFETFRQAARYQNRLYGMHESVQLISWPDKGKPYHTEDGLYIWEVK